MKDNERFNRAFANVDDKYVMAAMKQPNHTWRMWQMIGIVAACLILVVGAYFPIRNAVIMGRHQGGAVFADTEQTGSSVIIGAQKPSDPPLPWEDTLYLKGEVETRSYEPGEKIELRFEIGLKNDYLGAGDLKLTVNAPDFDVHFEGIEGENNVAIIENRAAKRYTLEQPLTFKLVLAPDYQEAYAIGTVSLSVGFVPADADALEDKIAASDVPHYNENWQTAFFDNGALRLGRAEVDYGADMVELRLDTTVSGAVDCWERMIAEHYKMRKISARELSALYCSWAYRDRIYASVESYMTVEHTVRFSYMSKNIRYRCDEYVDAPEMWTLYEKVRAFEMADWNDYNSAEAAAARRALAEYILLYMREQGIITIEEYETEAAWMAQTSGVGNFGMGFDQNIAPHSRVIQKYMYTH